MLCLTGAVNGRCLSGTVARSPLGHTHCVGHRTFLCHSTPPEMVRTDLTPAVLQLKALGIDDIAHFDFMDAPPAESLIRCAV